MGTQEGDMDGTRAASAGKGSRTSQGSPGKQIPWENPNLHHPCEGRHQAGDSEVPTDSSAMGSASSQGESSLSLLLLLSTSQGPPPVRPPASIWQQPGADCCLPKEEALCAGNRWDLMTRLCPAGSSNPFPARRDRTGDQDMAMGKGTQREPPAKLSPSGATGQGEPMDPIGQELR